MADDDAETCRTCGHDRAQHEHYRAGTECATCGPDVCPAFRPDRPWYRRLFSR